MAGKGNKSESEGQMDTGEHQMEIPLDMKYGKEPDVFGYVLIYAMAGKHTSVPGRLETKDRQSLLAFTVHQNVKLSL